MDKKFIDSLFCPFCNEALKIGQINGTENSVVCGIASCLCSKYPIVSGILYMKPFDRKLICTAIEKIEKEDSNEALNTLLNCTEWIQSNHFRLIRKLKQIKLPFSRRVYDLFQKKTTDEIVSARTFFEVIGKAHLGNFGNYLKYRFSHPSFIASLPIINDIRKNSGAVVDLGCGVGNHLFYISNSLDQRTLVGVDSSFFQLYLAKKYFCPKANYICADVNYPLPFRSRFFEWAFSSDLFNYIINKKQLSSELSRIVTPTGSIAICHLHNRLTYNPVAGVPLDPDAWASLFSESSRKLISEKFLLNKVMVKTDHSKSYMDRNELGKENAFCLVAGNNATAETICEQPFEYDFQKVGDGIWVLNPLFGLVEKRIDCGVKFRLEWPNPIFRREYEIPMRVLPDEITMDSRILGELKNSDLCRRKLERLIKSFVIIKVPENFI